MVRMTQNWLTRKPVPSTFYVTIALTFILLTGTNIYLNDVLGARALLPASWSDVFEKQEYWRLWTTLFAHADIGHILSNLLLFFPFAYFLYGHFGSILFPWMGFIMGGITNAIVLQDMPANTHLIGASGVVHWMGAAWMTLYLLIDHRESKRRQIMKTIMVTIILFIPQKYQPEVSYFSHFVGFLLGIPSALAFYWIHRLTFKQAEVYETDESESSGILLEQERLERII